MTGFIKLSIDTENFEDHTKVAVECRLMKPDLMGKVHLFKALYQALKLDPLEELVVLTELSGLMSGATPKGKVYKPLDSEVSIDEDFLNMLRGKD